MSKTFKIVLILLVIASIVSAVLAVLGFLGKEREYTKRLMLEEKLVATLKNKRRLEKELDLSKKVKEESEKKIVEMETEVKRLSSQLEMEKDKSNRAVLDLTTAEKEVTKLEGDLEKERIERLSISKRLKDLQIDYDKIKKEKTGLERKLSDLKERYVDLDTIVVSPSRESVFPKPVKLTEGSLKGRVLVVNKDYNFVVTDLGQDDNVRKGMVFEIREDSKILGKVELDKVYETMSSASILPGSQINNIKKGNLVIESR